VVVVGGGVVVVVVVVGGGVVVVVVVGGGVVVVGGGVGPGAGVGVVTRSAGVTVQEALIVALVFAFHAVTTNAWGPSERRE
jgi:hypothetical protein